jgi:hypothetical protein
MTTTRLPSAAGCTLEDAGQDWDVILVPRTIGAPAVAILGSRCGAVVDDPLSSALYFFTPVGTAAQWRVPGTRALGDGAAVTIPPARRTEGVGPHWRVCPGKDGWITDPRALQAALEDSNGARQALTLIVLPTLDGLSEAQVRGKACVWCGVILTAETAVDLGPRRKRRLDGAYDWFPRGCKASAGLAAFRALHEHAPTCEQCVDDGEQCETGRALWRLVRDGFRYTGLLKRSSEAALPCEPCMTARTFGGGHQCMGAARGPAEQPCPCCGEGAER